MFHNGEIRALPLEAKTRIHKHKPDLHSYSAKRKQTKIMAYTFV